MRCKSTGMSGTGKVFFLHFLRGIRPGVNSGENNFRSAIAVLRVVLVFEATNMWMPA